MVTAKILMILKKYWIYIVGAIFVFFFILPMGKSMIAKAKTWISLSKYKSEPNSVQSIDFHLLSVRIFDAFHGSWIKENEKDVIALVNALPEPKDFNALVFSYASDYSKDLRAELRKFLNDKQYSQLKYK